MNFLKSSYKRQEKEFKSKIKKNSLKKAFDDFFEKGTVRRWKYERIANNLVPLFKIFPKSYWLTIGDGRFGEDAEFIQSKGISVTASDISDYLLKYSKEKGKIKEIRKENAEKISLKDDSVDFTFCKEAYHHFPRPYIAVYEMLRVSKEGIILIEPTDYNIDQNLLKQIILKILKIPFERGGIKITREGFESVGNYIYRISKREIRKIATGMDFPYIAFKGINDYNWKSKDANFQEKVNSKSKTYNKTKKMLELLNFLSKMKMLSENLTMAIIFKKELNKKQIKLLELNGFEVIELAKNPYLK